MRKLLAVATLASLIGAAQVAAIPATAAPWSGGEAVLPGSASALLLLEAHYTPPGYYHAPHGRQHRAPPRYQVWHQPYWHRPASPRFDQRHPGHWR